MATELRFIAKFLWALAIGVAGAISIHAQGPCGGKPCPVVNIIRNRKATNTPRPPRPGGNVSHTGRAPVAAAPICEDSELSVVCGMPGCEMTLNGADRQVTDELGGITFQVEGKQKYKVRVTKPGYNTYEKTEEKLQCGEAREIKATLPAKPVALRIRTRPAECDIFLDGQKQPQGSDAQGMFFYVLANPTLLVEARKKGYLSSRKNIFLRPELANSETLLALDPISATVTLSANIESASVRIDDQKSPKPVNQRLLLPPGAHILTIEALGYAQATLELTVGPDESLHKDVTLQRLPIAALQAQASTLLSARSYDDVLKLSRFMLEAESENAMAHRLIGLVYVARGDFGNAAGELSKALTGNETVVLPVRRHAGEKFDLGKGHDLCPGQLVLTRSEVEFKSGHSSAENFKVGYDQMQIVGIQLKSNAAVYLGTKVTNNGKRRDYNFYSYDRELSQAGKPYLEMILRLLHPH
jgi:hypothetical protein